MASARWGAATLEMCILRGTASRELRKLRGCRSRGGDLLRAPSAAELAFGSTMEGSSAEHNGMDDEDNALAPRDVFSLNIPEGTAELRVFDW